MTNLANRPKTNVEQPCEIKKQSRHMRQGIMRLLTTLCLLLFFMMSKNAHAQNTWIKSQVIGYSQQTLSVYHNSHHLFEDPVLLDSSIVDNQGNVVFEFSLKQTTQLYIDLGFYHIYFIISPGDSLLVELPVYKPLSQSDKYNVFFKPESFYTIPISGDSHSINQTFHHYEYIIDTLYSNALRAQRNGVTGTQIIDGLRRISHLENMEENKYLQTYLHYQVTPFFALAYPYSPQLKIDSVFRGQIPELENPAFWEAFNGTFRNPFLGRNENEPNPFLIKQLLQHDFSGLNKSLSKTYTIQQEDLTNVLIIKGIYDLWHSHPSYKYQLLKCLDSLAEYLIQPHFKTLTVALKQHFTSVYTGYPARTYDLPDYQGKLTSLTFKNKTVLLNFCSPELQQCAKDFLALEMFKKEFGRKLEIINIVVYQSKDDFINFASQQQGNTHFVHWNENTQLLKDYQIKGLPSYFIVDPEGKFIASPAPGPDAGLHDLLEDILKSY